MYLFIMIILIVFEGIVEFILKLIARIFFGAKF